MTNYENENIDDQENIDDHFEVKTNENPDENVFEHYRFVADKGQSLMRVDKFLSGRIENISRSRIQNAADTGSIMVNEHPVKSSYKVKPLDLITIMMPYEKRIIELIPENIPLNIVYEDDDVLVVDKQAGLVVHPGHGNYTGTLVNALAYHLTKTGGTFDKNDVRGGLLVHRIDKDTSGLLVVAKNIKSHVALAKQFFDHTTIRRYKALVWGSFEENEGTVTGAIGRSLTDKLKMKVFSPDYEMAKHAVTHYKVLEELSYVSLIECKLETGRTHQIRVHMEHIGHPLFNDRRYGGDRILRGTSFSKYKHFVDNCFDLLPRQALHAAELGFIHPTSGELMLFKSDLPQKFEEMIDKWRNYLLYRKEFE